MNQSITERLQSEARELKCVNGAMYFGSVEDDSCNCKTRCQNEQTDEHALEELDGFIAHTVQECMKERLTTEMGNDFVKRVRQEVLKEVRIVKDRITKEYPNIISGQAYNEAIIELQDIGHVKE
jgi:hypothetical protein